MSTEAESQITLVNVVLGSDCYTGCQLDLERVNAQLSHTSYNPDKLPAVVHSPPEKDSKVMIFRTGKMTCTGGGSVDDGIDLLQTIGEQLEGAFSKYQPGDPVINNLVATGELAQAIDLKIATIEIGMEHVEYEPEQFPAVVHRPFNLPDSKTPENANENTVVLLFATGKVVITGNTTVEGIKETYNHVINEVSTATRVSQ